GGELVSVLAVGGVEVPTGRVASPARRDEVVRVIVPGVSVEVVAHQERRLKPVDGPLAPVARVPAGADLVVEVGTVDPDTTVGPRDRVVRSLDGLVAGLRQRLAVLTHGHLPR